MIWLVVLVSLPIIVVVILLAAVAAVPTLITDEVALDWSPLTAATGLAVWQIGLFVATSLVAVLVAQSLIALKRDWLPRLPATVQPAALEIPKSATVGKRRHLRTVSIITVAFAFLIAAAVNFATLSDFDDSRVSEVLAHRGWVQGGVENTLPALHAAKQSGAHRVEFDVLQTKDEKFVVMHDTNLRRLAGIDRNVKDMTQAELMQTTVRAGGMEATIPSLEQWIETSKELDLPQLLEVKIHGAESPDMIPRLLAVLDAYEVTDWYIYHSLSREVVEQLKAARPALAVGYIVPINFGGIPHIDCDFIVIEEASYSESFLRQARDADFAILVWTPNTQEKIRVYMRDGADGVITDEPQLGVVEERTIADDYGLAPRLLDRIERGLGV
jgi:glycerophosphoryl diester phosphodiesterase